MNAIKAIIAHGPLVAWTIALVMISIGIITRDILSLEFTKDQELSWSLSLFFVITGPLMYSTLWALKRFWTAL